MSNLEEKLKLEMGFHLSNPLNPNIKQDPIQSTAPKDPTIFASHHFKMLIR